MSRRLRARGIALLALVVIVGCARLERASTSVAEPWLAWQAPLYRENALAGRIYDTQARRFITPAEAAERARTADFVLLGEKHDNPDHHRLQAWLIGEIVSGGRKPAIAFEMIPRDRSGALDAGLAAHPDDPDALAAALDWSASGWPPFPIYRPVFAATLDAGLRVVPGDLSRAELGRLRHQGFDALPEVERARLALDPPPSAAARNTFAQEVREAHCGMAPDALVDAMINVQRVRDATLADALLAAADGDGAVLIAGAGHVRRDPGAPVYLGRRAPQKSVLALAFAEVPRAADAAIDPDEAGAGFDLIWFTPRVDDEDACERFKDELEKMRAPKPTPQA